MSALIEVPIEERIAAAFSDDVASSQVAQLLAEVEGAVVAAGEASERARERALDPALSKAQLTDARREMDDAAFRRDRMQVAMGRLRERQRERRAAEEQRRRWAAYDAARETRDGLAKELARVYPPLVAQLVDLLMRLDACDREIERINTRALPADAERLREAELVARGLTGFVRGVSEVPRLARHVRLPEFQHSGRRPYAWPLEI